MAPSPPGLHAETRQRAGLRATHAGSTAVSGPPPPPRPPGSLHSAQPKPSGQRVFLKGQAGLSLEDEAEEDSLREASADCRPYPGLYRDSVRYPRAAGTVAHGTLGRGQRGRGLRGTCSDTPSPGRILQGAEGQDIIGGRRPCLLLVTRLSPSSPQGDGQLRLASGPGLARPFQGLPGWGRHPGGLALTLGEALLRLLPIGVLLGLLLGVVLGGLVVGSAADGGGPVQGLQRLLWRPQGHVTPGSSLQVGQRGSSWEPRGEGPEGRKGSGGGGGGADSFIHPALDCGASTGVCAEEPRPWP